MNKSLKYRSTFIEPYPVKKNDFKTTKRNKSFFSRGNSFCIKPQTGMRPKDLILALLIKLKVLLIVPLNFRPMKQHGRREKSKKSIYKVGSIRFVLNSWLTNTLTKTFLIVLWRNLELMWIHLLQRVLKLRMWVDCTEVCLSSEWAFTN